MQMTLKCRSAAILKKTRRPSAPHGAKGLQKNFHVSRCALRSHIQTQASFTLSLTERRPTGKYTCNFLCNLHKIFGQYPPKPPVVILADHSAFL